MCCLEDNYHFRSNCKYLYTFANSVGGGGGRYLGLTENVTGLSEIAE
jgi:hypothetical protein